MCLQVANIFSENIFYKPAAIEAYSFVAHLPYLFNFNAMNEMEKKTLLNILNGK